jgi:lipopolysaccharide export system protein LptA
MTLLRGTAKLFAIMMAASAVVIGTEALAQGGPPKALQGFSTNRDQPVRIQAAALEVRDKDKVATFSGDVHVVQGDTDMRCKTLRVFYEQGASKEGAPAQQGAPGGGQIRRMEALGKVVVTQKDQVATGDRGDFDMRTNTVTLTGKVVVTKGEDVLRGERLVVNLTDGVSRMEGGRVEGMFNPKSKPDQKSGPGQPAKRSHKN